ncbi:sensor histidine kinase [Acidobacteriota bacterium]
MKNYFGSFRSHGHHIVFILSILSLAALITWWSVFIHNSIQSQRLQHYSLLEAEMDLLSHQIGSVEDQIPRPGILPRDNRFEVVLRSSTDGKYFRALTPHWPNYYLRVRSNVLEEIERESASKNFMLFGESGLLVIIILISSVFLYSYIRLEKQTLREIKEFWERSAHEIKTPITGIKAFLQNLKAGVYEEEKISTYVDLALGQIDRQEKLARNILSGVQLKSEDAKFLIKRVALADFIRDYLSGSPLILSGIDVDFLSDESREIFVSVDPNGLKVILDNIFDNAVKYGPQELKITVRIEADRKRAVILIRDNGFGFNPVQAENMFEAYKHLEKGLPVRSRGTGMGLFISRGLARSMKGDLEASSPGVGEGSEFRVILCSGSECE